MSFPIHRIIYPIPLFLKYLLLLLGPDVPLVLDEVKVWVDNSGRK